MALVIGAASLGAYLVESTIRKADARKKQQEIQEWKNRAEKAETALEVSINRLQQHAVEQESEQFRTMAFGLALDAW